MEARAMPSVTAGLARYRITVPERPGRYALLDIPADVEDPIGLVELFAGTHLHLLAWSTGPDDDAAEFGAEPLSGAGTDHPSAERNVVATA